MKDKSWKNRKRRANEERESKQMTGKEITEKQQHSSNLEGVVGLSITSLLTMLIDYSSKGRKEEEEKNGV